METSNPNQLVRITEVVQLLSLGKSTIRLWVAQGKLPEPITLSPTIKEGWCYSRVKIGDVHHVSFMAVVEPCKSTSKLVHSNVWLSAVLKEGMYLPMRWQ